MAPLDAAFVVDSIRAKAADWRAVDCQSGSAVCCPPLSAAWLGGDSSLGGWKRGRRVKLGRRGGRRRCAERKTTKRFREERGKFDEQRAGGESGDGVQHACDVPVVASYCRVGLKLS